MIRKLEVGAVICEKLDDVMLELEVLGLANLGWLKALKNSKRDCSEPCSPRKPNRKALKTLASATQLLGPRK